MTAYLSIDIDYWWDNEAGKAKRFFHTLKSLQVPTICVVSHEEILQHVNANPADVLINIDAHSDLCPLWEPGPPEKDLCDGNWANYVAWRHTAEYRWCYPYRWSRGYGDGLCGDDSQDPYQDDCHDWGKTTAVRGIHIKDLDIVAVGIAASPAFADPPMSDEILKYLCLPKEWSWSDCYPSLIFDGEKRLAPVIREGIYG